ncbi:hypothetical protein [Mesorhizobium sp.]|uniref:hypothetical protein n=2 Tax=Mesorhizobium TaxID=68287 RepID=UPI000F75E558|nr:hypothetical protein [Mesorhizobium sp.]AZO61757.1 hypothetical protein EJ078_22690 [Mesorhizobium sp. M1A.F.Ca.IN.022.06.1.1]RWG03818.1 MAG: hypothetical protein EOQ54_15780 [Mesorhizobium sp.]TIQ07863.1 MAG: hypothetical protein E5X50_16240 [Mesorhizobium sp.]TIQ93939.1 MAG: hypothetical protein E5X36_28105 [Mesorhizobium sp.]TIR22165.1 MAG: hypothetical protein E5X33_09550 [Mesorhizobium sp.]
MKLLATRTVTFPTTDYRPMTLNDLAASLHQKSGFGGARLEAITFAAAIGLARYAGAEHQTYFKRRFAETIEEIKL